MKLAIVIVLTVVNSLIVMEATNHQVEVVFSALTALQWYVYGYALGQRSVQKENA